MTVFFNLFLIILGFGLLIFVHELGHFLAARWAGIRVEGFAIGFGPPLVSYRDRLASRLDRR
jgi:regulator of sigma E protease